MSKIIPAILTADEKEYVKNLKQACHVSDLVQIDIIDGKFAKNRTLGPDIIAKYPSSSSLEIQLLVKTPSLYINKLISLDFISRFIIPREIEENINEIIYLVKNYKKQIGISINPKTAVEKVKTYFDDIDFLQFLAVEPGFSGQKFQNIVFDKVKEVKTLAPHLPLEVDGGINFENAKILTNLGIDFLAANSVLFKADDFYVAYEKLARLSQKTT